MSINPHNGWPKKALDKLAQAERLRHIMRLSGRKCWNGRGMSRAYIKAETKIYDLEKYRKSAKREGAFGALDMERDCTVHT